MQKKTYSESFVQRYELSGRVNKMQNFRIILVFVIQAVHFSLETGCDLSLTSSTGNFTSPGYPSKYLASKQCRYSISVPVGKTIQLDFISFNLGKLGCVYAELKVYEGTSASGTPVLTKCGTSRDSFISETNQLYIVFKATLMTTPGFKIRYTARDESFLQADARSFINSLQQDLPQCQSEVIDFGCNLIFGSLEGTFVSPKYSLHYPDSKACTYKISGPLASKIHLIFSVFILEESASCSKDSLSIYEGSDTSGTLAAVKCGRNTTQLLSMGNSLFLQFKSDASINEQGFRIYYFIGNRGCHKILTGATGNTTSPAFPSSYPNNAYCTYKITSPKGTVIQLRFRSFFLPGYGDMDRLKIYEGTDSTGLLTEQRTWGITYPYLSTGNNLFLVFETDSTGTANGFDLEYSSVEGCNIHLTSRNGAFTSPLYPHSYPNNTLCNYTITVQAGYRVHLHFLKFKMEYQESCLFDSLSIYEGSGANGTLAEKLCGDKENKQFISAGNKLFLQMKSNEQIANAGFMVNYYTTQLSCNQRLTSKSGKIKSPNNPHNYPNNALCSYEIAGKVGETIQVIFSKFFLQMSAGCNHDSIKIYENSKSSGSLVSTRCGNDTTTFTSTATKIFLVFTSDMSVASKGYEIYYQVGPEGCGGIFTASSGQILSPGYPSKYPNNAYCSYKITAQSGKRISIFFSQFSLQYHEGCKTDNLQIYEGLSGKNRTLTSTRCGSDVTYYLSTTNQVLLNLKTDSSEQQTGFQIYYYIGDSGCNKKFTSSRGTFKSPSSPQPYPNNAFCTYSIEVAADKRIQLNFQTMSLQSCCSPVQCDTLKIYDGVDSSGPLLKTVCGTLKDPVVSSSNGLYLEFKSDGTIPNYGFTASYITKGPGYCIKQKPCQNNGTCVDVGENSYKCNCLSAFTGVNCSVPFIPCASTPCQNGGRCQDNYKTMPASFECICKDGYSGKTCQNSFEECDGYMVDDRWQRSASNKIKQDSTSKQCDDTLKSGWYRFTSKAGEDMPTKCPDLYSCGTSGSIWGNGTLPAAVGDYSSVTACVRDVNSCCSFSWTIRVKKCHKNGTDYHVYQLQRPPKCPMAYCAGKETPCPDGWNSPTGFTPGCTNNFPKILSKPTMTVGVKNNRIEFKCEFKSDEKDNSANFEVTWYEGTPLKKINHMTILKGTKRVATLQNNHKFPGEPLFRLGTMIFCRVRSWYTSKKYAISRSPVYESNHYFAGIKVDHQKSQYTITEASKPLKLKVTATVPIVCQLGKHCRVLIDLGQDNMEGFLNLCTIEFKPGPANQTQEIEITAKRDFINDGNRRMVIKITVLEHVDPCDWNKHHNITHVIIIIIDIHTERCTSSGDPHLITFDKLYYNHYKVGDYVLVNSTCRIFEVHVRTWKCAAVTCNCGIAAREGNDVIVVDMCRDGIPRARFASRQKPAEGTSIRRDPNGKSFKITFPSGAFIRMDNYRWYGNVYYANLVVQVPSDDFNCTVGLCGTFDKNMYDDMRSKDGKVYRTMGPGFQAPVGFTESWKIPAGKSLFYYKDNNAKCKPVAKKRYCTCTLKANGKSTVNCDYKLAADRPNYSIGLRGWKTLGSSSSYKCNQRKRRAIDKSILLPNDEDFSNYIYDPAPFNVTIPSWPTKSGKTKNSVTVYCTKAVKDSKPGKVCGVIPTFNYSSFIDQCIEDVKITDNEAFSSSAIRAMQDACEEIFLKNTSYWKSNPTNNGTIGPPMDIANTLCPSLCSGNGKCVNATCICDANYTSADCSVDKSKGPTVLSVASNGLCDVRMRNDCHIVRVAGYDFMDSDQLACRATKIKISNTKYENTTTTSTTQGYLLSFGEVLCKLNSHSVHVNGDAKKSIGVPYDGYLLEISNDRMIYSKAKIPYVIFDSKCMECNGSTATCSIKRGTCNVNGYCFTSGETASSDRCSKCDPNSSKTTFTADKSCTTTKSNLVVIIVSSVIGSILVVALLVFAICKLKKRQSKMIQPSKKDLWESNTFKNAAYES